MGGGGHKIVPFSGSTYRHRANEVSVIGNTMGRTPQVCFCIFVAAEG